MSLEITHAYFCKGFTYWPMKLSPNVEHSILRTSVLWTHYSIREHDFRDEEGNRAKMLGELIKEIPALRSVLDTETETCIASICRLPALPAIFTW